MLNGDPNLSIVSTKKWYLSGTTWATAITAFVGFCTMMGIVHIGPVQVQHVAVESEGISQFIMGLIELVLGAVGLWRNLVRKTILTT